MGRTLLLTGRPGVGKTTVIKEVVKSLGEQAGGFYTEEIRERGQRQGFRIVTLDGREAVMAHVGLRGSGRPRVSRYGVDVKAVEQVGVAALRQAVQAGQVVVVDEIGKMELLCEPFKDVVLQAVDGPETMVATGMTGAHPWVNALKARPNVAVWQVTVENRDHLAQRVLDWLAAREDWTG